MKLSSSPSSLGKLTLLSLLSLLAVNKKSLSQNLTSSDSTKVQTIKTQLELLRPDTITPTKVDYTYLGTARAPADSVISGINITSSDDKTYHVPMILLDDVKGGMSIQSGPIGVLYEDTEKEISIDYEGIYYRYALVCHGDIRDVKVAIGKYVPIKGFVGNVGEDKWFMIERGINSDHPLYKSIQYLFTDIDNMGSEKPKDCTSSQTPLYTDSLLSSGK